MAFLQDGSPVNVATLSLGEDAMDYPYVFKGATGLDAADTLPSVYSVQTSTTIKYYSLTPPPRDITFNLELNPDFAAGQTISSLRDALYRGVSWSRATDIHILFINDGVVEAALYGNVKRFESDTFAADPSVRMMITCKDPYLVDPVAIDVDPVTAYVANEITIVDEISTAPHGFKFNCTFLSDIVDYTTDPFLIADDDDGWAYVVYYPFETGDILWFSTELGDKYLYVDRGGIITHLMDKVLPGSVLPILFPGTNDFRFGPATLDITMNSVTHKSTFWGV